MFINLSNKELSMNAAPKFTESRIAMLNMLKDRIKDPAAKNPPKDEYGNKLRLLNFDDYVIYAVIRNKDYRKTSHMEDGANAKAILVRVSKLLKTHGESSTWSAKCVIKRFTDGTAEQALELAELIDSAIARVA